MSLKQAQNIAKQRVQELRAWEKVEAVLNAALGAEMREVQASERVRALTESAGKWGAAVEEARARYAEEEHDAALALTKLRCEHVALADKLETDGNASKQALDTALAEALATGEKKRDALTAQCRALEEQRETLEGKSQQARDEYAAMLKKLGVTNG